MLHSRQSLCKHNLLKTQSVPLNCEDDNDRTPNNLTARRPRHKVFAPARRVAMFFSCSL
jgi:hypothetical protein